MRGLAGFLLLATGLGFGAYSYDPSLFAGAPRIALAKTETGGLQPTVRPAEGADGVRVFSPRSPLFTVAGSDAEARAPGSPVTVVADATGPVTRPVGDWTTTIAPTRGSRPSDPEARADLVRQLQTELKRVGCYEGDIDGSWGPGSRRAMATFTERINASLPNEDPDFILLTLVQGHRANACGACPTGETLSDGKCVPKAVIASTTRSKRGKAERDASAASVAAVAPSPVTTISEAPSGKAAVANADPVKTIAAAAPVRSEPARSDVVRTVPEPDHAALAAAALAAAAAKHPTPTAVAAAPVTAPVVPAPSPAIRKKPAAPPTVEVGTAAAVSPTVATKPSVVARHVEPLPGRMTIGGPLADDAPAAPVTATAPAAAATDDDEETDGRRQHSRAIPRAPRAVPAPQPRVVHTPPPPRAHAPRVHTPAPPPRREVHKPQPQPRVASAPAPSSSAQRQRAMVYNLFQRPDRY